MSKTRGYVYRERDLALAKRRGEIFAAVTSGEETGAVAERYGVTRERIHAILRDARKALEAPGSPGLRVRPVKATVAPLSEEWWLKGVIGDGEHFETLWRIYTGQLLKPSPDEERRSAAATPGEEPIRPPRGRASDSIMFRNAAKMHAAIPTNGDNLAWLAQLLKGVKGKRS